MTIEIPKNWYKGSASWNTVMPDGSWLIVTFENLYASIGEVECKRLGQKQFLAWIFRVEPEPTPKQIATLRSFIDQHVCPKCEGKEHEFNVELWQNAPVEERVEILLSLGIGTPLGEFSAGPSETMSEEAAAEFVRGAAISTGNLFRENPMFLTMALMDPEMVRAVLKGEPMPENSPGAALLGRRIGGESMAKCRFHIPSPAHYRSDGSCRCDDEQHRKVLIASFGVKPENFSGVRIRGQA